MTYAITQWRYSLVSLLAHATYIAWTYWLGLEYFFTSVFFGLLATNLTIGLYIHRTLAHRMYNLSDKANYFLLCLTSCMNFGSAAVSAAVHVNHHKYSDTNADPHSVKNIGLFRFLIKDWRVTYKPHTKTFLRVTKNEHVLKQHRNHFWLAIASALLTPYLVVWGFWLLNFHFLLNHRNGNPVNINWAYPVMWGEERHKDHHLMPSERKMHNYDLLYYIGVWLEEKNNGAS